MNRLKGEFESQKAVVMLFPSRNDVWRYDCKPIRDTIVNLANILSEYVHVIMGVLPELMDTAVNEYSFSENVELIEVKYNDCWSRDTISSVVEGDVPYVASFNFNAYGGELYSPWDDDNRLDGIIAEKFGYKIKKSPITLEGGNYIPDGNGTLFLIKDSIINDNRNPGMTQEEIEQHLLKQTCSKKIIWLETGLDGDETGGHIDNVMAFSDPHTILISWTDDKTNPHYEKTHKIEEYLKTVTNCDGKPYIILHVPIPEFYYRSNDDSDTIVIEKGSLERKKGDKILETYINFAISNGVVVVPQFNSPLDKQAIEIISKAYSDRTVIPLYAREASLGGGGFHCLTKHIN